MRLESGQVASLVNNRPVLGTIQTADTIEQTGLAGAIWPDDGKQFPFIDAGRYLIQRLDAAKPQGDMFDVKMYRHTNPITPLA